MIANLQNKVTVHTAEARAFVHRIIAALRLDGRWFNVSFVDDHHIRRLNEKFLGRAKPTDVLSFPWQDHGLSWTVSQSNHPEGHGEDEFTGFLGDIVISAETARRNAAAAGHSTGNEIRWLILHGALHLLGYDHATDRGEMTALELALREQLGIDGRPPKGNSNVKGQMAKCKW
jgi:probable rRNA maturation factor